MGFFDFLKITPSTQEINTKIWEELQKTKAELSDYKEHGTSDPTLLAQAQMIREALKANKDNITDYHVTAAFAAIYMRVAETRKKLIREVDKMRQFYMVDVIVGQLTEDALAPQVGTGDVLFVTSDRPELQKEIDYLDEKFDFDQMSLTLCPDILAYGEYTLATKINPHPKVVQKNQQQLAAGGEGLSEDYLPTGTSIGPGGTVQPPVIPYNGRDIYHNPNPNQKPAYLDGPQPNAETEEYGLLDLLDNVDQAAVVALSKWGSPEGYLVAATGDGKNPSQVKKMEAADFVKFSLSSMRIKLDVFKEWGIRKDKLPDDIKNLPKHIRVGKSQIYGAISKLKELELLESLVPATKLSKLSNGSLVGIRVPAGYDIQKALEAAKQVEGLINKKIGVDPILQEITVENIMATAGRLKAVPIFGETGTLQKLDYKQDEPDDLLASVTDVRKTILTSAGVPYGLIYGGEENRGEILKKYARYLRKLRSIQKAIEEGIRQIVYIHLSNKGYEFTGEDIKIEFYNKLIEVDNLDKLEFIDATIGLLRNATEFFNDLADRTKNPSYADQINVTGFLKFLNEQLNIIGFHDVITGLDNAAPGNPIAQPTQIPGVNRPMIPPQQQFQPQMHKLDNPLLRNMAMSKPKKFITTRQPNDGKKV